MRITYRRLALVLCFMAAFAAFTVFHGIELNGLVSTPAAHVAVATPAPSQAATLQTASVVPENGATLSLLSIIGFGVLSGGLISALRTRSKNHDE